MDWSRDPFPDAVSFEDLSRPGADGAPVAFDAPSTAPSPLDLCEREEREALARKILLALPEREAYALYQRFGDDASRNEIGAMLGLSRESIRQAEVSGLARARALLFGGPVPPLPKTYQKIPRGTVPQAITSFRIRGVTMRCEIVLSDGQRMTLAVSEISVTDGEVNHAQTKSAPTSAERSARIKAGIARKRAALAKEEA